MSQELPIDEFGWVEETSQFNKDFIKNYNEDSDIGYFIHVDAQNLKNLCKTQNDLPIFPEIIKIEKKMEKLIANLHDKEKYVIHITNLKQPLDDGLV